MASKTSSTTKPSSSTKLNYINTNSTDIANVINQAQAIQQYGNLNNYIPDQAIDTSYWATDTGGGKNALHGNTDKNYKATAWTQTDYLAAQKLVNDYLQGQEDQKKADDERAWAEKQNSIISGVTSIFNQQQAQSQAALQNAQRATAEQINSAYDQSARDYYRLYKTQQKSLPENLSRAGVTGGASESSQLKLMNSYSDNLYQNEAGRNNQLAGNDASYNNQVAQNSINVGSQLASMYYQQAQDLLNYERQQAQLQEQRQYEAQQAEKQRQAQLAITNYNAMQQADMEKVLAGGRDIWVWTDENGYLQWTDNEAKGLANGGTKRSPSKSNVRQVSNTYSGGDGDDNKKKDDTSLPENYFTSYDYKVLEQNMTNALIKGATREQLQYYSRPIQAAYEAGSITEEEANRLLSMLK